MKTRGFCAFLLVLVMSLTVVAAEADPNAPAGIGTWATTNWPNILAALFAAYAFARTIVLLTPTPKDDRVLAAIPGWLTLLAKVFGLDIKQGR